MAQERLDYTEIEVRSFLPSGWNLVGSDAGSWDSKKGTWTTTVLDNVDYDWKVEIKPADVLKLGRLDALKVAVDRVYRERLG
jgi:hypothetical protein